MMSYLVRREKFADGTPPPKKPYSAVQFKNKADTLLQGVYGTGKSSNAFLVDLMQKELDKAVTEGVVTMQEGLEFIKSRKKYYDDYLLEKSKTTDGPIGLPQIEERTELADGTPIKFDESRVKIPTGEFVGEGRDKSQIFKIKNTKTGSVRYTTTGAGGGTKKLYESIEEVKDAKLKSLPDEFFVQSETPYKDGIKEVTYKNRKTGKTKVFYKPRVGPNKTTIPGKGAETLKEAQTFVDNYFKENPKQVRVRDPEKKYAAKDKRRNVTKKTKQAEARFTKDKGTLGLGKELENAHTANIFQAKKLGVEYPTDALSPQTTKQNQVYAEILNEELKPLYKEQIKLKKAFDQTPSKEISALINKNNTAIQNLVASGGKQGEKAANLLRGWNVDVVTGEVYLPEGGFNTLKAVDRGMTDTTLQNLKARTTDDVVARANYEELLKEMKGKKIPVPEKSKTRDMFKKAFNVGKMVSKPIIRAVSPFIPIVGTAGTLMGAADVAEASTFTKKPDDLGIAYLAGPEVAKKYGEFKESVRGKSDEFEEFVP